MSIMISGRLLISSVDAFFAKKQLSVLLQQAYIVQDHSSTLLCHDNEYFLWLRINLRSGPPPPPPQRKKNDRSERKEGLIQLLAKRRVKSPESGLFSDWSKNNSQERAAF